MRKPTDINIAQWQYTLRSHFLCETEKNEVGKLLSQLSAKATENCIDDINKNNQLKTNLSK